MIRLSKSTKIQGLDKAVRELNGIDKGITRQLRKDLGAKLRPVAREVASDVQIEPPLSGMNGDFRTAWKGVRAGISFTPTKRSKLGGSVPILSMTLKSKGKYAGFEIAEMAGSKNLSFSKNRQKGRQFVNALKKRSDFPRYKAGRFGYGLFLKRREEMRKLAIEVIDTFAKQFNKKVRFK